jgi:hypothetical protein
VLIRSVCLFLASLSLVYAQITTGQIAGTVFDSQGGVVPDAGITAKNDQTGQSFPTRSNEAGAWYRQPPARHAVLGAGRPR